MADSLIECVHPIWRGTLAAHPRDVSEMLLEDTNTVTVYHMLRQMIVLVNHGKDRALEQI